MAREILFHGKRKDNGEWVYGYYYRDDESGKTYIIAWEPNTGTTWAGSLEIENFVEVIPETVGQYIGRTDVNDKRIFVGNIVEATVTQNSWDSVRKYTKKYVVAYHQRFCYFYLMRYQNNLLFDGNWQYGVNGIKVVGNIHDNPELLNGTES